MEKMLTQKEKKKVIGKQLLVWALVVTGKTDSAALPDV